MPTEKRQVFCLMGPTASGKTDIACALSQRFSMEIVSIDSATLYREMDIGSAKPSRAVRAQIPHHLIDILDPPDGYSVAKCCEDVLTICQKLHQEGKIPLLVGGTMMYFNALQNGLSPLPDANESIRDAIMQEALCKGWPFMHAKLCEVDAASAKRIHPHDTQRIQRALEVFLTTNIPLSVLCDEGKTGLPFHFINFAILPEERAILHARIAARFVKMLEEGLIDEVQHLVERWSLTPAHASMRSVGYRHVLGYLQGEYDRKTLLDKGVAATRQLAKRQLTWLRHWPQLMTFVAEDALTIQKMEEVICKCYR